MSLTLLRTCTNQVDDVLVLSNFLHCVHFRQKVSQLVLSSISWKIRQIIDYLKPTAFPPFLEKAKRKATLFLARVESLSSYLITISKHENIDENTCNVNLKMRKELISIAKLRFLYSVSIFCIHISLRVSGNYFVLLLFRTVGKTFYSLFSQFVCHRVVWLSGTHRRQ